MRLTDMADELYTAATDLPGGVRAATAKRGGVTVTRVEIAREGLEKPRGRYVTLEVPSVSVLDERDAEVIEQAADELRALLPPEGPVLVLGVGNRRVTADALGPRTVQKIFVTMGAGRPPVKGIRPVAAVAPGVSASTGLSLQQLAGALVREVRPTALICVDSLCSSGTPSVWARTLQFSDTASARPSPAAASIWTRPVWACRWIAAGIPTLMMAQEGKDLVVTPRELDSVIAHGAALLGAAINRALQPRLSIAQLCWLVG